MAEYASAKEYFDQMSANVDKSKLSGVTATYLFDITGAGQWTVDIADGEATVEEGQTKDPTCTISATEPDWLEIAAGKLDPTMAFMGGKLKVKGDMAQAMKLQSLV